MDPPKSVNQAIIDALEIMDIPCNPEPYRGDEERYFTFNITSDNGCDFGDNEPEHDSIGVYVHYWCPSNYNYIVDICTIRKLLMDGGFSYARIPFISIDPDNGAYRHIVFDTEYIMGV